MSDGLIPPESPQNGDGDHRPDEDSGQSNKDNLFDALEIFGGIIFAVVGVGFSDAGLHILAFIFYFLSVGCGIGVITHYIKKAGSEHYWKWFWSLMALNLILFVFLSCYTYSTENPSKPLLVTNSEPQPHFTFSFHTEHPDSDLISLTNGFLVAKTDSSPNLMMGALFVPVLGQQSNVIGVFTVKNNSSNFAEHCQVKVTFPSNWVCPVEVGWQLSIGDEHRDVFVAGRTNTSYSFVCGPFDLYPGDEADLPRIVMPVTPMTKMAALGICAKAKDSSVEGIGFRVYFPSKTKFGITDPFILCGIETNGSTSFEPALWKFLKLNIMANSNNYVEGTDISRAELNDLFPFGYAVFFFNGTKCLRYEVITNGLLRWTIDWNNVRIVPNFPSDSVQWTIPKFTTVFPENNYLRMDIQDSAFNKLTHLKRGIVRAAATWVPNSPALYVGTLSDDQTNPMFVIGLRIPPATQ